MDNARDFGRGVCEDRAQYRGHGIIKAIRRLETSYEGAQRRQVQTRSREVEAIDNGDRIGLALGG